MRMIALYFIENTHIGGQMRQIIFKLPGGLVTCWIVIIFFVGMIGVLSLEDDTRRALMVSPVWFILLIIGYLGFYKQKHK
ncbi:hypothetical protein [Staphylococcus aureus]|uniref:hypothetical protein n=1 Tax=Staphylococcus aureus TaxID=1280 RepID=UPI001C82FD9D